MAIYYSFIFLSFVIGWFDVSIKTTHLKKLFMWTVLFILSLFMGFRYKLGLDWLFYSDLYSGTDFTLAIEPGYLLISRLSGLLVNYWVFQYIVTLVLILSLVSFFKIFSRGYTFCVLIFFIYQFGFNAEAVRQLISLSLVLIAYTKYLDKKILWCCTLCAVAVFFHASALVIFSFLLILTQSRIRLIKIICYVGVFLSVVNVYPIDIVLKLLAGLTSNAFVEKIFWYGDSGNANSILTFSLFFKFLIIWLMELRRTQITKKISQSLNERAVVFIYGASYFMLLIDIYLGRYGTISTRLDVYMIPVFIVGIFLVINEFKNGFSKNIFYFFVIIYFSINFIRFTDNYYFQHMYVPYRNYIIDAIIGNDEIYREYDVMYYWDNKEKLQ